MKFITIGIKTVTSYRYRLPFAWKQHYEESMKAAGRYMPMYITIEPDAFTLSMAKGKHGERYNVPVASSYINLSTEKLKAFMGKTIREKFSSDGTFRVEIVAE